MKFEEEKAYRRSRELDSLQPSVDQQQSSSRGTGSQGPGGQGTSEQGTGGTSVSVTRPSMSGS